MSADTEPLLPESDNALGLPNAMRMQGRKRPTRSTHSLTSYGRHFCRTVHAMCSVYTMITNGLLRSGELQDRPEETFTHQNRRGFRAYNIMLDSVSGLEECLVKADADKIVELAALIQKGALSARADDTKTLKGAIIDWVMPRGEILVPPLSRHIKSNRGFKHPRTGYLLCPAELDWDNQDVKAKLESGEQVVSGDQWPLFVYQGYVFDKTNPWSGLLRSDILVCAYKHIFTSPSSVEREPRATRSGNARLHGMTKVTAPSIAYIATQVRFALSSASVFTRTDTITDTERFYETLLDLLEDVDEQEEVNALIDWWNRQIFPSFVHKNRIVHDNTPLALIKQRRRELQGTS